MTMSIAEKIDVEIWQVLKQLKRDLSIVSDNEHIIYEIAFSGGSTGDPSPEDQRKIIYKLERLKIVAVVKKYFIIPNGTVLDLANSALELQGAKPKGFLLRVAEPAFNDMFEQYEKKYLATENSEGTQANLLFYIRKKGDDFYYKGDLRTLSKNPDWYKVFCAVYDLLPEGGEVSYTKLGVQIKSRIKKTKGYNPEAMRTFIQRNLTDRSNGFLHYANIPTFEDNGKPLLYVNRGKGVVFNNKSG